MSNTIWTSIVNICTKSSRLRLCHCMSKPLMNSLISVRSPFVPTAKMAPLNLQRRTTIQSTNLFQRGGAILPLVWENINHNIIIVSSFTISLALHWPRSKSHGHSGYLLQAGLEAGRRTLLRGSMGGWTRTARKRYPRVRWKRISRLE